MKLKYHYTYPGYLKFSVLIGAIVSFFFIGFGILCLSGISRPGLSNSDIYLFAVLFLAFCGFGLLFLITSIFVHRNMKQMATSNDWYGITIEENTLISQDFSGLFRRKPQQIDKYNIEKTELRLYKGVEVLTIETPEKTVFLPVHLLTHSDKDTLLEFANPNCHSGRPIAESDLRIAEAFLHAVEKTFNHRFPKSAKRIGEDTYLFGFDANENKTPHIYFVKCGPGGGTYTGFEEFRNEFELRFFRDERKKPLWISIIEAETILNGYAFDFYFETGLPEEKQKIFKDNFNQSLALNDPLPQYLSKILRKSSKS